MRNIFLILYCLFNSFYSIFAQKIQIPEVFIPFYFEDAAANKDTVYMGLDPTADKDNNWYDYNFGEKDITTNWKENLEVRAATYAVTIAPQQRLKSKIFVIKGDCKYKTIGGKIVLFKQNVLFFHTNYLPITISWNPTIFQDSCLSNSFFHRYNWSRYGDNAKNRKYLTEYNGSFTVTKEYLDSEFVGVDDYLVTGKIIYALQVYLYSKNNGITSLDDKGKLEDKLSLLPNPTFGSLRIKLESNVLPNNTQLRILNTNGQIMQQQQVAENATQLETDVSTLPSGLYFVQLRSPQGLLYTGKFVKIE
jgi:hypothetical protein